MADDFDDKVLKIESNRISFYRFITHFHIIFYPTTVNLSLVLTDCSFRFLCRYRQSVILQKRSEVFAFLSKLCLIFDIIEV